MLSGNTAQGRSIYYNIKLHPPPSHCRCRPSNWITLITLSRLHLRFYRTIIYLDKLTSSWLHPPRLRSLQAIECTTAMPGILPMKVIRVGTSAQSRIAQACDRCRSKKIRCDGVTPCCSQCSNVGFECKTSDKLSRRAFPRGYTESLEDRVRTLEGDVKELKDLLEKKDEQIDILSRIRPNPKLHERPAQPGSLPSVLEDKPTNEKPKAADDVFKVQYPPYLLSSDHHDTVFMGASSSISFVGGCCFCLH